MFSPHAPAGRGIAAFAAIVAALAGPPVATQAVADDLIADRAAELSVASGAAKPPFTLDDLAKRPVSLADTRGDIVLVHFFATWCEPCREELPALRRLVERSDPARLAVISISVAEIDMRVRGFVEKTPVNFPVLLDRDRRVATSWNVSALPTTFILDHDLQPRLVVERDYDWDRIDLTRLLTIIATGGRP